MKVQGHQSIGWQKVCILKERKGKGGLFLSEWQKKNHICYVVIK